VAIEIEDCDIEEGGKEEQKFQRCEIFGYAIGTLGWHIRTGIFG